MPSTEKNSLREGTLCAASVPRVVYWNSEPSPYFVRRMNALHDRGNIQIEAWFSQLRDHGRDWAVEPEKWRFPSVVLPPGPRRVARVVALLRTKRPHVFVTLYGDYAFASAAIAAKSLRTPTVIHAMRTFSSWRTRSVVREIAKRGIFRMADAVQVTGPSSRAYAEEYGASPNDIFAIREEIDIPFWSSVARSLEPAGRAALRSTHGLSGCLFLYVGRLWWGKGIDALVDAYAALRAASVDCSLVLIGTGDEEQRIRARVCGLDGVLVVGHQEGKSLGAWYDAADVFVFPTLGDPYGQVVMEAMASGLPVISTTSAGDIEDRVVEGRTGYLIPPNDVPELVDRMRRLASDSDLRVRLGAAGRERIADWSTENWAARFEDMIYAVTDARTRR